MPTAQEIAEHNTILRATVGSTLHGLAVEGTDDRDEMGVCLEPPEYVLGLGEFHQWVQRDRREGERSQPGDLDLVVYSLRKWARLALAGNPTVLLLLFAPKGFLVEQRDPWGRELQALAPAFVGRHVAKPFLGYLNAQRQRLLGERGQKRCKRPELEAEHGYDTKYAMHMLRLGFQGVELLSTGRLEMPITDARGLLLRSVRAGETPLQDVLTLCGKLESNIKDLAETVPLPPTPDAAAVDEFLVRTYQEWWNDRGLLRT